MLVCLFVAHDNYNYITEQIKNNFKQLKITIKNILFTILKGYVSHYLQRDPKVWDLFENLGFII